MIIELVSYLFSLSNLMKRLRANASQILPTLDRLIFHVLWKYCTNCLLSNQIKTCFYTSYLHKRYRLSLEKDWILPSIPGPGQLDFLEHGADHGVDPLRLPFPGIFNWFPSSILNCFAIALQFSQSIVHTLFLGELKLKNLLIMIGDTAPGSDVPVLLLSMLDLAPRLVGLSIDIAIASDFPSKDVRIFKKN